MFLLKKEDTERFEKYDIYLRMLGLDPDRLPEKLSIQKRVEDFETEAKEKFINEPANMKLLSGNCKYSAY